jgi:hypothetical protein
MTERRIVAMKEAFAYPRKEGMILVALHGYDYESDFRTMLAPAQALALAEMLIRSSREILDRKEKQDG